MNESLEFHYKEMVRLAAVFDSHSKDAFNDFKLLGAVGALLSWGPLSSSFEQIQPKTMLLGFLAILAVTGLVGIFAVLFRHTGGAMCCPLSELGLYGNLCGSRHSRYCRSLQGVVHCLSER
jgi:hypothetical protein